MTGNSLFWHFVFVILVKSVLLLSTEDRCTICKDVVKNFEKGMKNTANANFGGGNTHWEESRLGTFARSETRLLEIMESICDGVSKESYCHAMIEQHEDQIENWWFNVHGDLEDFRKLLCIELVKVCCAAGHYGSKCTECPAGAASPCSGHGDCKGDGTRGGDGKCSCKSEYTGSACEECNSGYRMADNSSACVDVDECSNAELFDCASDEYCLNTVGSFECKDCHVACESCAGPSSENCTACKSGYRFEPPLIGCKDINECNEPNACAEGSTCVNSEGSYTCSGGQARWWRFVPSPLQALLLAAVILSLIVACRLFGKSKSRSRAKEH